MLPNVTVDFFIARKHARRTLSAGALSTMGWKTFAISDGNRRFL